MATIPSDPLFNQQWHLHNENSNILDLNVIDVWDDYTGAGVEVAIIDDAVQRAHPDLDGNYSRGKDWDFRNNDSNPSGVDGDNHGTAVAGIIGANANGIGGVGVAYGSTIFGFQSRSFQNVTDAINNASGITETAGVNREADVVNMSIGTPGDIFFDNGLNLANLETAINGAAIFGRDGLGTILVKSAGNSRDDNQDTNASSWNANRHTISVAAVNQNGFVSNYSTHGASLLVSAFGTPGQVVTTDRVGGAGYNSSGDYTSTFNGTSAAAPMVSGVVALMLEANPDLGWRDVQEILAYSARHVGTDVGSGIGGSEEYAWGFNAAKNWNGGGLHFSNDYGFGLVDAKAAVRLAETWDGTPQVSTNNNVVFEQWRGNPVVIPDGNAGGLNFQLDETSNIFIEHFELEMDFETTYTGDVEITVTSPSGTSSRLIDNSGGETEFNGDWTFTSNAFRGEESRGIWTINVVDSARGDTLRVNDFSITSWGSTISNNDTFIFTNEYSDYANRFEHTTSINGGTGIDKINAAAVDSNTTINLDTGSGSIDGVAITTSGIEDVVTGDGNDYLIGSNNNNRLYGGNGNDTLGGDEGNDLLKGGDDNDKLYGDSGLDLLYGENGDDYLSGGHDNDQLYGGDGRDTLGGGAHNDYIIGDSGNDELYGGHGVDTLGGGEDNDTLYGGDHGDKLYGDSGLDLLYGEDGNDYLSGGNDNDKLYGGDGRDTLAGGSGDDLLMGEASNDVLYGSYNNDTLYGGTGNNALYGDFGNHDYHIGGDDLLIGGSYNDSLYGGAGSDRLDGDSGYDTLYGGSGNDVFVIGGAIGAGHATIWDYSYAENDRIYLSGSQSDYTFDRSTTSYGNSSYTDTFIYKESTNDLVGIVVDNSYLQFTSV